MSAFGRRDKHFKRAAGHPLQVLRLERLGVCGTRRDSKALWVGWRGLSLVEWALLVLTIALVFIAETANTIVETTIDLIVQEHHPLAGVAKDMAAGAVLLSAIAAVVIGLLILGPHLWERLAPLVRMG